MIKISVGLGVMEFFCNTFYDGFLGLHSTSDL